MPDVKIFVVGACVERDVKEVLIDEVPEIVAEELSSWFWSWKWPFRSYSQLDPENVDVTIFWDEGHSDVPVDVYSNTQIIIEIAAYRRRQVARRITTIAQRIKIVADKPQEEDYKVTITFFPVKQRHWARA